MEKVFRKQKLHSIQRGVLALILGLVAGAASAQSVKVPVKFKDQTLHQRSLENKRFSDSEIYSNDFVERKLQQRKACTQGEQNGGDFFPTASNMDDPISLFLNSETYLERLDQMESQKLLKGSATAQPWSGDYWPIAKGILGARVFDPVFQKLSDWLKRFEFVRSKNAQSIIGRQKPEEIAKLSPSEKYDLLIGDTNNALTGRMWREGKQYQDSSGKVEEWMGICHGWAPAAIAEPRPKKGIDIKSLDGKYDIHFSPAEVKGLVSFNWATNRFSAVTLGARCDKKNPPRDENGRLIDPECFDINPATWHIVVVNKLGQKKESFIMDATYDYEVWNQPVFQYSYSYFNPSTKKPASSIAEASVDLANFKNDRFTKYRSDQANSVVGIVMKVGYTVETSATPVDRDSQTDDLIEWVEYKYDLEIDKAGKIVGGEWYVTAHPDFIWINRDGQRPKSSMDRLLNVDDWKDEESIPNHWATAARAGAARGVILDTITNALNLRAAH